MPCSVTTRDLYTDGWLPQHSYSYDGLALQQSAATQSTIVLFVPIAAEGGFNTVGNLPLTPMLHQISAASHSRGRLQKSLIKLVLNCVWNLHIATVICTIDVKYRTQSVAYLGLARGDKKRESGDGSPQMGLGTEVPRPLVLLTKVAVITTITSSTNTTVVIRPSSTSHGNSMVPNLISSLPGEKEFPYFSTFVVNRLFPWQSNFTSSNTLNTRQIPTFHKLIYHVDSKYTVNVIRRQQQIKEATNVHYRQTDRQMDKRI